MFAPDNYRAGALTHQLLAVYLYRKLNGSNPELDRLIGHLSRNVAREEWIDFRVTDLYLQRVATLLACGYPNLVRRRWVERVIEAQEPDGGWLYRWHGWDPSPYRFGIPDDHSTSHPTAQGMWIVFMLKYQYPDWVKQNFE